MNDRTRLDAGDCFDKGHTRRSVLKKAGTGVAIAWTVPQVLSGPAFAQGTLGGAAARFVGVQAGAEAWWTADGTDWIEATTHPAAGNDVVAVASDGLARFFAVDDSGQGHLSTDGGDTWGVAPINISGAPLSAVGADDDGTGMLFLAGGDDDLVYRSTDGGTTWASTGNAMSGAIRGIAYGGGTGTTDARFVVVDEAGDAHLTTNGGTSFAAAVPVSPDILRAVAAGAYAGSGGASTVFVAGDEGGNLYFSDPGGGSWNAATGNPITGFLILAVASAGNSTFVAVNDMGQAFVSADGGDNWSGAVSVDGIATSPLTALASNRMGAGALFVAGDDNGLGYYSDTPATSPWTASATNPDNGFAFGGIAYGAGV